MKVGLDCGAARNLRPSGTISRETSGDRTVPLGVRGGEGNRNFEVRGSLSSKSATSGAASVVEMEARETARSYR